MGVGVNICFIFFIISVFYIELQSLNIQSIIFLFFYFLD